MRMSSSRPSSDAARSTSPATWRRFSWICSSRLCTLSVSPARRSRVVDSTRRSSPSSALTAVRADSAVASSTRACETDRSIESSTAGSCAATAGRDLALSPADHGPPRGFRRRLALALALALELHDAGLAGPDPLAERLDVQPRAHLGVAGGFERREHPLACRRVQDRARRLEGVVQLVLGRARRALRLLDGERRLGDSCCEPLALRDGGFVTHASRG